MLDEDLQQVVQRGCPNLPQCFNSDVLPRGITPGVLQHMHKIGDRLGIVRVADLAQAFDRSNALLDDCVAKCRHGPTPEPHELGFGLVPGCLRGIPELWDERRDLEILFVAAFLGRHLVSSLLADPASC